MCSAITREGYVCNSQVRGAFGHCWHHTSETDRAAMGYRASQKRGPSRQKRHRAVPEPEPEEPVRLLPRLLNDARVIVKLRQWAEEFDAQDRRRRYTAQQFIEWIELEHIPAQRPKAEHDLSYPVIGVRMEAPRIPDRLLQVG